MFNQNKDRKQTRTFLGNYRGTVVDNKDPKEAGRLRIRIHTVYDDIKETAIPWAIYADPLMGGGINSGGFFVPDIGDDVWCFFESGDFMKPVYFAGAPSALDLPSERKGGPTEYPFNRVFKTKQGHVLEFDDTDGNTRIRVKHKSGTELVMLDNGDMTETVVGNLTRTVTGNLVETISGNATVNIEGNDTKTVSGDQTNTVSGSVSINAGTTLLLSSSGAMTINGSTVDIN